MYTIINNYIINTRWLIGLPVHLLIHVIIQSIRQSCSSSTVHTIKIKFEQQRISSDVVKSSSLCSRRHQNGDKVGARGAGFSSSETVDHLGFSHKICRGYTEWFNALVRRDQRRMARLVRAHEKASVTQISTLYNYNEQKSLSEHTLC